MSLVCLLLRYCSVNEIRMSPVGPPHAIHHGDYLLAVALPDCNTICLSSAVFTTWKNFRNGG